MDKRDKKNIYIFILFAAGLLFSIYLLWKRAQPEEIIYEIVEAKRGNIERKSLFSGKITPTNAISIKPNIAGTISKVYKKEGDYVNKGEAIAQVEVITNNGQIQKAQSRVDDLFIELEAQKKIYDRHNYLHQRGLISVSDMEKATALYQNTEEEYIVARDNLNIIQEGFTTGLEESSNIYVRSTISGTILEIPVRSGVTVVPANILNIGTTIAVVGDTKNAEFSTRVDESEVNRLYIGMPINVILKNQNSVKVPARISYMSLMGWKYRGAVFYEVKASLEIPDTLQVSSRTSANAEICVARKDSILIIPEHTVFIENDSTFVWLHKRRFLNDMFEKRQITTGLSDKVFIEVLSGLEEGERIRGTQLYKAK